jgi:hypothetical protein
MRIRTSKRFPAILVTVLASALLTIPSTIAAKSKPKTEVVDTVLAPGPDNVTFEETGGGRDAERKTVEVETPLPASRPATVKSSTGTRMTADGKKTTVKKHSGHEGHAGHVHADSLVKDTVQVIGTPGSPTGAGSRGMPGEKPVPGTK